MTYDNTKLNVAGSTYDAGDNYTIWAEDWNGFVAAFKTHASRHKSGGLDQIKLDELASPTDITTLDVTIAAHGLCPKLPNDITKFLSGDGTWRTVVSSGGDVVGPSSSVDGNVVTFDGLTGKEIKDGLVALSALAKTGDAPTAHAASHKSGQSDVIKLDELGAPADGTTANATTSLPGLLLKATAPASGLLNFVGIGNGETAYTNKPLFDTTNPEVNGTAAPGTQVIAARRDHIHGTDTSRAPISSPAFTDVPTAPTAPNGTATGQLATTAFVQNTIAYLDPLLYKGTIDCSTNPDYPAADAGNCYIASVGGKIGGASGKAVLVGDMILCNHDGTASGDEAAVGIYWNAIQANMGAVIGPASSTDGHLVLFDGPSGKAVKDGGTVPVVPAFDTTATNIKINGTQSAGSSGLIPNSDHVHPTDTSRAAATALGTWGDSTITPTWSEGTPDITSTIARHVRNGNVLTFAITINISDGHDAVLDSISLPVAAAQIANLQVQLSSFKLYSDGVDDVMSDPFAYVDFNAATPLIKFHSGGSFPTGCSAVLNIAGSYGDLL
jgi:hypothetical protein